jgi:hypothetical protein
MAPRERAIAAGTLKDRVTTGLRKGRPGKLIAESEGPAHSGCHNEATPKDDIIRGEIPGVLAPRHGRVAILLNVVFEIRLVVLHGPIANEDLSNLA